jgi:predicted CoA-binding protein
MSLRQEIDSFLAVRRIAVVGVSTHPQDFSRVLFRDLLSRGYDALPVNPKAAQIEGQRCYASIRDITPCPEGVLIMTPPSQTDAIVKDSIDAGVRHVWMHRGGGAGAVSASAIRLCHENSVSVVPGECPFMFLPNTSVLHQAHGWVRKAFHPELR